MIDLFKVNLMCEFNFNTPILLKVKLMFYLHIYYKHMKLYMNMKSK